MKKHAKKIVIALLTIAMLIPTVAMIYSSAAQTYTVELAYENIFVFEKWANNSLSSTVIADGQPNKGGELTTNIQNGSFTMTKTDMAAVELYTAFSTDAENAAANEDYYIMEVEPNTTYTFEYNVTGNIHSFTPYVFMFTNQGLFAGNDTIVAYGTPGYGVNSFSFTTPANVVNIQIRFTIGDSTTGPSGTPVGNHTQSSVYATVKDIAIYKTELYDSYMSSLSSKNLFDFDSWAGNSYSSSPIDSSQGTIATDTASKSITFTTTAGAGNTIWTGNAILTSNPSSYYYSVDVESSTSYTFTYSITDSTLPGAIHCQTYIAEYNANGENVGLTHIETPKYIGNQKEFTTTSSTEKVQIVFTVINNSEAISRTCKVYDIGIYESSLLNINFETLTGHASRQTFTYESNSGDTYGTLPTPTNIPEGMVFAGWYTGKNGMGERIHSGTEISYESMTVFAKYEPAVDTLTVKNNPTKTTYTVGEKFNPAGLILTYGIETEIITRDEDGNIIKTETVTKTTDISNGFYCTPEYLNTVGTQTITAYYGGKTTTFTVTVTDGNNETVVVNGTNQTVKVANNKYTLEYSTTPFNRYEITYYTDSYVKGVITFDGPDGDTEEFFLEPSNNGSFASYIDGFIRGLSHYGVMTIEFTCLNKEFGKFELYSLNTINTTVPSNTVQYFENEKYKVGIDLAFGGVISYIECLEGSTDSEDTVVAAQYTDSNGKVYTKVDYEDKLPAGAIATVESVNLINTNDRGRYLQQSYYGTDQPPFVMGDYNGVPWNYNPVQGGNLQRVDNGNGGEASKVIDYRITGNQIYVKTRPLDWGKNSVDYADDPAWNTPSYMEAWYTFTTDGKGLIQGTCRFIDYSGYPSNTTTQEFPALYTIEPLNHFVYNEVSENDAWDATQEQFKNDTYGDATGAQNIEEPDFWGILPSYSEHNPDGPVDPNVDAYENWAAFTASEDKDSFGIGIYSPGVSNIHYGCFVAKYEENQYKAAGEQNAKEDGDYIKALKNGTASSYVHKTQYRHASTLDPAVELHTSYIAPIETLTFESYTPITYTYYVSTGTADEIREDFRMAKENEENAEKEKTKITVPETVYMTPVAADATYTTTGQYYVNNILNEFNIIETLAESKDNMYVGLYALDAKEFTVKVTNATNPSDDIELYRLDDGTNAEGQKVTYPAGGKYTADNTYGLRFKSTGLKHGEMATAKWEITVTLNDGSTKTYTAYTVLYAPEYTVGAVAEARRRGVDNNETGTWISGATSMVTDANGAHQLTPIGGYTKGDPIKSGYFKQDPLVYPEKMTTTSTDNTADDHINVTSDATAYVMQTAVQSNDHSRARSYLGLLTIDKSRYTNTNQIPNLKIGYDVLHVHDGRNDALKDYKIAYTLGSESSFNPSGGGDSDIQAFPSGWSTEGLIGNGRIQNWDDSPYSTPFRQTVTPNYIVSSDMDGQYIHTVSQGLANYLGDRTYGTSVASVMIKITDKSELRDAVLDGYNVTNGTPLFNEKIQNAATVLGDPTSTQEEIDNAKKELKDAFMYALKYDNLFSALEFSQHSANMTMSHPNESSISYKDGALTIVNSTLASGVTETYSKYASSSDYYLIDLEPNTEYVFEYDVTTTVKSQAFLFFYNSAGASGDVATNISVQTNGGTWASKTESNPWIGNYQGSAGTVHYAIKFTTGANTTKVGFRFGNTSNSATTSTFSNIKLIDSAHYYEEATYSKTEEAFQQKTAYGVLITPERPGYTFAGWKDAAGNTITGADIATNHRTVYSVWTANNYTITYKANGGNVSPTSQSYTPETTVTIPSPIRGGYVFGGWKVTASDGSWTVGDIYQPGTSPANMYGNVTLEAQWGLGKIDVFFDSILDFSEWNTTTASDATFSNVTENGFTLTSNAGAGEGTSESPEFPVTAGKQYYIDIDITGDSWDVYIFFRSETVGSTGIGFTDPGNRYSSNGEGNASRIFTAPAGATNAVIRVEANGASNAVTFSDIRVYEANTCAPNVDVPYSSKEVTYGSTFGTLPVPTRDGYTFQGWYDGDTLITAESTVTQTSNVYLKSKWVVADTALVSDTVVIDFATPAVFVPFINDTIFNAENGTKAIVGFSKDGVNYTNTLAGNYGTFSFDGTNVTYTPSAVVNGIEDIYYHASLTVDGVATIIKNKITVAPASNILYEESLFTAVPVGSNAAWNTVSVDEATANKAQSNDNVYGYDSNTEGYNRALNYSNGSAYKVTVDSEHKSSQIMKFEFTGTGFDLNGVCGPETGVFVVSIKNNATGKFLPAYIVDTYYSDSKFITETNKNLYQVPIIHETGLDYGTYTIQVASSYLPTYSGAIKNLNNVSTQAVDGMEDMAVNTASVSDVEILRAAFAEMGMEDALEAGEIKLVWFDENSVLNGGMGINTPAEDMLQTAGIEIPLDNYIDSVRVYNPIQNGNDYYIASEQNAVYYNVIGNLLSKNVLTGEKIFAYISGNSYVEGTDTYDITLESYEKHGPKDELYLTSGTSAVAFKIKDYVEGSVRVMISLRAAYGTPTVKIGGYQFNVLSNTEMYYDITDYIGEDGTVTIQNQTANTLLSIGSLKITSESVEPASISSDVDLEVARTMMFAVARDVEPNTPVVPDEPEVPDDTTTPDEPADDNNGTTEEPADDNSDECWLVRLIKHVIEMLIYVFNIIKDFLGF